MEGMNERKKRNHCTNCMWQVEMCEHAVEMMIKNFKMKRNKFGDKHNFFCSGLSKNKKKFYKIGDN